MSAVSFHPFAYRGLPVSNSTPALCEPDHVAFLGSYKEPETPFSFSSTGALEYDPVIRCFPDPPRPSDETKVPPPFGPSLNHPHVKHGGDATLLLTGHKTGTTLPFFPSGSLISGTAILNKPASVTALEIKLEGVASVREIQGGGRSNAVFFSDKLLSWDTTTSLLLDDVSFRRIMPALSHDGRLLPPTFDSRLSGIPGFRVSVRWQVVLTVTRARTGPLDLLRRTMQLSVPIRYMARTRPPLQGPFPLNSALSLPTQPRTSFVDIVHSRKQFTPPIQTQIYLPNSQIMPMCEPISFRIVLWAPDAYLKPFLVTHSPRSFLPLDGTTTTISEPVGPVRVHVARRIHADPRSTFVIVIGQLITPTTQSTILAEGTLNKPEHGEGWIGWRGEVCVPLDRVGGGGFVSDRVIVQDELVLTLDVPNMPTHVLPFSQAVPIRLTTDLAETSTAMRVTEV